ncbi:hypothetical protein RRG08_009797 [Elysia crispata]|uniref:Uncharacterized protein n=1 Tax=Elysia crispata TaxID=231223 RepID=A0AAE0Y0J9_9GAST|nr:hypothetical protein RRG08_009797 [Elysia crispata]
MVVICHTHRQDKNGEGEEGRKKGYQKKLQYWRLKSPEAMVGSPPGSAVLAVEVMLAVGGWESPVAG